MLILSEASLLINDCLADLVFDLSQLLLKLFLLLLLSDYLTALTLETSFVLFDVCKLVPVLPLNLTLLISKNQLLLKEGMSLSLESFELLLDDRDMGSSIFFTLHRGLLHTQFINALFSDIDFLDQD